MVSLSGLIPCNTPWMAVAGVKATASSSNALHLPISRSARRYPFNGEMAYSPLDPPLTTLEFYHRIAGGILHHAQRMIRQEILLETLLFVSVSQVKSGWLSAKIPVISSIYGPLLSVRLLVPRLAKFTVSPTPLFFTWRNMVVGNVQQTAIFIVTPRANKIVL